MGLDVRTRETEDAERRDAGQLILKLFGAVEDVYRWMAANGVPSGVLLRGADEGDRTAGGRFGTPHAVAQIMLDEELYTVRVGEYYSYDQKYVDVTIRYAPTNSVDCLLYDDAVIVVVSQDTRYEYPPKSAESLIFFLLNRELDLKVESFARRSTSENLLERLESWSYTRKNVLELRRSSSELAVGESDVDAVVSVLLNLQNHPSTRVFAGAGNVYLYSTENDAVMMYMLGIKKDTGRHTLYTNYDDTFLFVFRELVPRREWRVVERFATRTLESLGLIPLVVAVLKEMDPDWFSEVSSP